MTSKKNKVLAKANDLLSDLVNVEGPVEELDGLWVCGYRHATDTEHSDKGFVAWAVYPTLDSTSPMLTRIFKK